MPSFIAVFVYSAFIAGLFLLDRRRKLRTSPAIYLPVAYIFLTASRPVSMWLGMDIRVRPEDILDGSPIDRIAYFIFLILTAIVLSTRFNRVKSILRQRPILLLFLAYCLLSLLWSEFPFTAFKRWVKLAGELGLMLIIVTEERKLDALKRFAAWPAYVIIPLSVLFIKYLPQLGRSYGPWSGSQEFTGVSYTKNMLGIACLMAGLGLLWTVVTELKQLQRDKVLLGALSALLIVNLWLLHLSESTAAQSCFAMGAIVLVLSRLRLIRRHPAFLHITIISMLSVAFVTVFFMRDTLVVLGEDSTLTGRTELWQELFKMTDNPVVGAGYESFWLGSRLEKLWKQYWWRPNQAHNGYIEMYINLGWIGIMGIAILLISTYARVFSKFKHGDSSASLLLAYVVVAIAFDFTEAAFRVGNVPWILLLLAIVGTAGVPMKSRFTHQTAGRSAVGRGQERFSEERRIRRDVVVSRRKWFVKQPCLGAWARAM